MGKREGGIPKKGTRARRLLEVIAVSGEFPAKSISRLPGGISYKETVIRELKKEGLLRVYYKDKLRGYRLGRKAKAALLSANPERFSFYLTGKTDTNLLKNEIARRVRLHRIAETFVAMQNAGVLVFRDEKPKLFTWSEVPGERLEAAAFYSSREMKELGVGTARIKRSRMVGLLLAPGGIFLAYHCGPCMVKWDYCAERDAKALMQLWFSGRCTGFRYSFNGIDGLLFGDGLEPFYQILSSTDSAMRCFFLLDGNYDHFFSILSPIRRHLIQGKFVRQHKFRD